LLSIHRAKGGGAFLIAARIAADRSQSIRRKGDEIGEREATRDVLDIGIESAVFVNYEHDRQLSIFCRASQIAFDRSVSGRRLHDFIAHFDAFVIRRYLLRPGVVGWQVSENAPGRQAAGSKLAKTIKESTAVNVAVLVFMKQVQQLLWII